MDRWGSSGVTSYMFTVGDNDLTIQNLRGDDAMRRTTWTIDTPYSLRIMCFTDKIQTLRTNN